MNKYYLSSFYSYFSTFQKRVLIHLHDVELKTESSLATVRLEHSLGIKRTYFFRIIPDTLKPEVNKLIANLGHKIGSHYEGLDFFKKCNLDKDLDLNYQSFGKNLDILRKFVLINKICIHGSGAAKYDKSIIWTKYPSSDLGLIYKPYFNIDFNELLNLTDTRIRWYLDKVSIPCSVYFCAILTSLINNCSNSVARG